MNKLINISNSDNGGDTWFGANNWPLRGDKGTLWEGGLRVAGFASGKGIAGGNRITNGNIRFRHCFITLILRCHCSVLSKYLALYNWFYFRHDN